MDMHASKELSDHHHQQQMDFLSMTSSVAGSDMNSMSSRESTVTLTGSPPSAGPMSLGPHFNNGGAAGCTGGIRTQQTYLPSLETNLHKILARKIQDSEEVSFRKSKLLTMAYYKLLRESPQPIVDPQIQVSRKTASFLKTFILTERTWIGLQIETVPTQ
jgi:hypothetical protein